MWSARNRLSVILSQFAVMVLVTVGGGLASGDTTSCQKLCTSSSPESPCVALKHDPQKYEKCVAGCQKDCLVCDLPPADPELVMRLRMPDTCPSAAELERVRQALTGNLTKLGLQHPDVRPPTCESANVSVLIWSAPPRDACEDKARSAAQPPQAVAGNVFAVYITKDLIRRLGQNWFDKDPKSPKQGIPDYPSIHLTHLSVGFPNDHTIETYIDGYDERPTPDVHFTTTIADQLSARIDCSPASDPKCGCQSSSSNDLDDLDVALAIIAGVDLGLSGLVLPLPYLLEVPVDDLDAVFHQPNSGSQGGVGCRLYQGLPDEIALPQGGPGPTSVAGRTTARATVGDVLRPRRKLVITYQRPLFLDKAVMFVATVKPIPRTPAVQIVGPSSVTIDRHALNVSAEYAVLPLPLQAADFYGRLTYRWSGDPKHVGISAQTQHTEIFFRADPQMKPGTTMTQTITVRVTDAEGSAATATFNVRVLKSLTDQGPPKPNPPPRCKLQPWLPECRTQPQ